ncbi:MnuA family membrane nuclease [Mycoplasma phocimorsus]|uniref:MnuA family membrane nuclease n=1 Tax=Mycoplasma phocimorsus TaxID=3045839 RepID=UPI0024BFE303|nr:hypothetical protein [Mycoplasma phocimorsus]MDJ1648448.1 hypothetical protein [Mycoplasma phocimorsus]
MKNKYKLWISAAGITPITFAAISCSNTSNETVSNEQIIEKTLSRLNIADLQFHNNVSDNIEFENGKKEIEINGAQVKISNILKEKNGVFVVFEIKTKESTRKIGHRFTQEDFLNSKVKEQEQQNISEYEAHIIAKRLEMPNFSNLTKEEVIDNFSNIEFTINSLDLIKYPDLSVKLVEVKNSINGLAFIFMLTVDKQKTPIKAGVFMPDNLFKITEEANEDFEDSQEERDKEEDILLSKEELNAEESFPPLDYEGEAPLFKGEVEPKYKKLDNQRRIGHWNILNYPGSKSKPKNHIFKVDAIATTIYKTRQDIVGLTEINFRQGEKVKDIQKKLNEKWGQNTYSLLLQPTSDKNPDVNDQTAEQIAVLYNHFYYKPLKVMSFGKEDKSYKRPLFGVLFKDKTTEKTIITIFGHHNSPGYKETKESIKAKNKKGNKVYIEPPAGGSWSGQGEWEIKEALNLPKAFEEFQKLDPSASIIFEGDTNIFTRHNNLFLSEDFKNAGIENYYGDMSIHSKYNSNELTAKRGKPNEYDRSWIYDYYETSAGREHKSNSKKHPKDLYANAYDKILFRENSGLNIISEKEKIDIKTEEYNNVWFKFDLINSYESKFFPETLLESWKQTEKYKESKTQALNFRFSESISDHTLVWVDYEVKK